MKKLFILILILCCKAGIGHAQLSNSGNLYIGSGTTLTIYGDIINNGTVTDSGQLVTLAGTGTQTISGSSSLYFRNLRINNSSAGGIIIANPETGVLNSLQLSNGHVTTTLSNMLSFADNALVSGASDNSYVWGPVKKTGNDAFVFPTGRQGIYQPIAISAPLNAADAFIAEYRRTDPRVVYGTALDATLHHLEAFEYWLLNPSSGNSPVNVTLSWNLNSGAVSMPADLAVARWSGSQWDNLGNGGTTGTLTAGTVRTATAGSSFGAFAIGSVSFANALPISLLSFIARQNGSHVDINWATVEEENNNYFTVERSRDKVHYETVAELPGAGNSKQVNDYFTKDMKPWSGISYYRLKQTDYNGHSVYSEPGMVNFSGNKTHDLYAFPNPASANSSISLKLSGADSGSLSVIITDINGKLCYSRTYAVNSALSAVELEEADKLAAGMYFLYADLNQHSQIIRLVIK